MNTESILNIRIKNTLNDDCSSERVAYKLIPNDSIVIYIQGGEFIRYFPDTNKFIISHKFSANIKINVNLIDTNLLTKLFNKLSKKNIATNEKETLRNKYRIDRKKRIDRKVFDQIRKYEESLSNK